MRAEKEDSAPAMRNALQALSLLFQPFMQLKGINAYFPA